MAPLKPFVQVVRVEGAEDAIKALRAMGVEVEEVGQQTEGAGEAGEKASQKTKGLTEELSVQQRVMQQVAQGATGMITSFAGFEAIRRLFSEFLDILKEIERLQAQFSEGAVGVSGQARILARQLGVDEAQGVDVLTKLRVAGGFDAQTASSFGVSADIAFADQGGLLGGDNQKIAEAIAAFAGSKGFTGNQAGQLIAFLKTAGKLGSEEEAKLAVAQVAAAATASKASSTGEFVDILARGGTGLIQSNVPFEDVLTLTGQARQVEVSRELAAQSLITLEQVAIAGAEANFNTEIARVAQERGLDPDNLTAAQRVQISRDILGGIRTDSDSSRVGGLLSPERSLRLQKSFRASNVGVTAPVGQAAANASVAEFEDIVRTGQQELVFQAAVDEAQADELVFKTGRDFFTGQRALKKARLKLDELRATRRIGQGEELFRTDESFIEEFAIGFLDQVLTQARDEGLDISQALAARPKKVGLFAGALDDEFDQFAEAVRRVQIDAAKRGISINVTNINTNYDGSRAEAGTVSPTPAEVGD